MDRCPQRKVQALGSEELTQGIEKGTKIRVTKPVTVFHAPKLGNLKLEGHEGTVVDVSCPLTFQRISQEGFLLLVSILNAAEGSYSHPLPYQLLIRRERP